MDQFLIAIFSSLWLGILTSISPCPLATNIAAVSYISKKLEKRDLLVSSILYTLGRVVAYFVISFIIISSIISTPILSNFLQEEIPKIIGPFLILTGMFLLELLSLNIPGFKNISNFKKFGFFTEFLLGVLFALSFCPVSAAFFFGTLIPLSVKYQSNIILPIVFGVGTSIPVIIFSILLTISAEKVSFWFDKISATEIWIRRVFGTVIIFIGIFYSGRYIFELF